MSDKEYQGSDLALIIFIMILSLTMLFGRDMHGPKCLVKPTAMPATWFSC